MVKHSSTRQLITCADDDRPLCSPCTLLHTNMSALDLHHNKVMRHQNATSHQVKKSLSTTHTASGGTPKAQLSTNMNTEDHITQRQTPAGHIYKTASSSN